MHVFTHIAFLAAIIGYVLFLCTKWCRTPLHGFAGFAVLAAFVELLPHA